MPGPTEPISRPRESSSFWHVVRLLRGEKHDYTSENLNRAVLLLAVPMVLKMIMESLFAVADVFWVSRLGKEAIAVVGLTESIMTLVYAVAIGISFAATAIISRRIGEKDPERAAQAAGQVLLMGTVVSVTIGVALSYFAPQILRHLNFFCLWLCQVPLARVLAETFPLGSLGVFIAVPIAFSALAIWSGVLFRRGKWKDQEI